MVADWTLICDGTVTLDLYLEPYGYGAILMVETVTDEILEFLDVMSVMTNKSLSEYDDSWTPLQQEMEDPMNFVDQITDSNSEKQSSIETINVEGGVYSFFTMGNCIEGESHKNIY